MQRTHAQNHGGICRSEDGTPILTPSPEVTMLAYVMDVLPLACQDRLLQAIELDLAEFGFLPLEADKAHEAADLLAAMLASHRCAESGRAVASA
jgi:hypothetical protein